MALGRCHGRVATVALRRPGGQKQFSDVAIETALILRLVFGLPLRQTEGFVRSVLALMGADLDAPDSHHTLAAESAARCDAPSHPGHRPHPSHRR